jgi:flagellar protein FliO/FliZ
MNAATRPSPRSRPDRAVLPGVLLGLLLALFAGDCRAADPDTVIVPSRSPGGANAAAVGTGGFNSLTLLAAAGLAAAGGWSVWRHRRRPAGEGGRPALAVEETRPLGNRQYLVVASYAGRKFLLGVCPGRIEMLSPLAPEAPRQSTDE